MSSFNPDHIRELRDLADKKCKELRVNIREMQTELIALEERVKVYDELLNDKAPLFEVTETTEVSTESKKIRAPRSTKAEMLKRKDALIALFKEEGFSQPKEIMRLLPKKLGYPLEQHHLRAVLRRFPEIFIQDPERHGYWGLISKSESET